MAKEQNSDTVKPAIVSLRHHVMTMVEEEVNVVVSKLNVPDTDRAALERLGNNLANKILHGAIDELKLHAGSEQQSEVVEIVQRVFGIENKDYK